MNMFKKKSMKLIFHKDFEPKRIFYQNRVLSDCHTFLERHGFRFIRDIGNKLKIPSNQLIMGWIERITIVKRVYQYQTKEIIVMLDMDYENHSDHHSKGEQNILCGLGLAFQINKQWYPLKIIYKQYDQMKEQAFIEIEKRLIDYKGYE